MGCMLRSMGGVPFVCALPSTVSLNTTPALTPLTQHSALCGVLAAFFVYFHRQCVILLRKYRSKLRIRNIRILDKRYAVWEGVGVGGCI